MNDIDDLYEQVARRCYVTSKDILIQQRLTSIIENALYSVSDLLGIDSSSFDYTQAGRENELLINYCMYRWENKSQKEFEENYMGDIIAIRAVNEVAYMNSLTEEDTTDEESTEESTEEEATEENE